MAGKAEKAVVVGSGLSGALMACYLGKAGYAVELYEKRADPRKGSPEPGRSINLALSTRGLHALEEVGVRELVLQEAVPMRGRMLHDERGRLKFQPYGVRAEEVIHSVSRAALNIALLNAAERLPGVRISFERRCVDAELEAPAAELRGPGGERTTAAGDFLLGADGAFSAVRGRLARLERFDYSQEFLAHGYKELTIPARPRGGFALEKNALHIWPRGSSMMIALPNADGSFTCTIFWPYDGPAGFAEIRTERQVLEFFRSSFPDAVPLMPGLAADFLRNPVGSLLTVRCGPWHHAGKVALIGDAAHAVLPFYGQGMNASFEDCSELARCLAESPGDRTRAFALYHARRKPNTDALAKLAFENFIEMRDHTASPLFLAKKAGERALARLFPGLYVPLYSLVTFSREPYAQAVQIARRQDRWIAAAAAVALAALLGGFLR